MRGIINSFKIIFFLLPKQPAANDNRCDDAFELVWQKRSPCDKSLF